MPQSKANETAMVADLSFTPGVAGSAAPLVGPGLGWWIGILIACLDWAASLILCISTLPLMALGLLWVLAVDRGNPFFFQVRIGLGGKPYRIYKIRTMVRNRNKQARFCSPSDDRLLYGGRFLRRSRIDELPQFFNVLRGEMALVGPRPEQPEFVENFIKEIPRYEERLRVKPGITGLAQIHQGYVDSAQGTRLKLKFDLLFIERRSVGLWFNIVLRTVKVVCCGIGSR